MASIVLQIVVVLVNRELSEGSVNWHMSVGVTVKIASNVKKISSLTLLAISFLNYHKLKVEICVFGLTFAYLPPAYEVLGKVIFS